GPNPPLPPVGLILGPGKKKLKIGVILNTVGGQEPDGEVKTAFENACKLLKSMGHKVSEAKWPVNGDFTRDFLTLWAGGAAMDAQAVSKIAGRPADATLMEP